MTQEKQIAKIIKDNGVQCNCDLDKWEPEPNTGHSRVCRIHKMAMGISHLRDAPSPAPPVARSASKDERVVCPICGWLGDPDEGIVIEDVSFELDGTYCMQCHAIAFLKRHAIPKLYPKVVLYGDGNEQQDPDEYQNVARIRMDIISDHYYRIIAEFESIMKIYPGCELTKFVNWETTRVRGMQADLQVLKENVTDSTATSEGE